MENFSEYLNLMLDVAKKSGEIIMEYYEKEDIKFERKGYNDIATIADKEAEKFIKEEITKRYPDHSILAEETGLFDKESDYKWYIDPIDGTTNFKHKLPIFSISIALEIKGELHSGIVFNPKINELFYAEKGKGAYLNGKKISVSDTDSKEFSLYTTGFSPNLKIIERDLKIFSNFLKTGHIVRRFGSAAIDLSYVACGRFDGFWEYNLHPWDIAAGILLVQEAGGKVTEEDGSQIKPDSNSIVASNGKMHEHIIEMISGTDA